MATIKKQSNGTYKISVSLGYDINHKQIRKTMTFTPEKGLTPKQEERAVQREAVLFEDKCRSGKVMQGSIRLAEFAEMWLKDRQSVLRPTTFARYKSLMPRINAAIGHMSLDRIQPLHLRQFYANLSEGGVKISTKYKLKIDFCKYMKDKSLTGAAVSKASGLPTSTVTALKKGRNVSLESAEKLCAYMKKPLDDLFDPVGNDKPLAPKTVLHYHRLISVIYSTAVDWEVVASNPCERTKPPKVGKPNPKYLDEKQAAKMLDLLEYESMDYRTMIRILLFLGMRRGELLGLNWSDIDFEHETMQIEKSSLYLADRGIFEDDVKNSSSERVIKIPLIAVEDLREYREWQTERSLQMGDRWHYECDRIFTNEVGLPLHPDTLSGWFKDFINAHSDVLPPITLHSLRHTNATLQIAGGVPITTVAMRLGHANTATTAKIYAHAIKSADAAAAETINDVFMPNIERTDKGTDKKPDTKRQ